MGWPSGVREMNRRIRRISPGIKFSLLSNRMDRPSRCGYPSYWRCWGFDWDIFSPVLWDFPLCTQSLVPAVFLGRKNENMNFLNWFLSHLLRCALRLILPHLPMQQLDRIQADVEICNMDLLSELTQNSQRCFSQAMQTQVFLEKVNIHSHSQTSSILVTRLSACDNDHCFPVQ